MNDFVSTDGGKKCFLFIAHFCTFSVWLLYRWWTLANQPWHVTWGPSGEARPCGHWPRVGKGQQPPCENLRVGVGQGGPLTPPPRHLQHHAPPWDPLPHTPMWWVCSWAPVTMYICSKKLGCRDRENLGIWFPSGSTSPPLSDSPPWSSGGFPCRKGWGLLLTPLALWIQRGASKATWLCGTQLSHLAWAVRAPISQSWCILLVR